MFLPIHPLLLWILVLSDLSSTFAMHVCVFHQDGLSPCRGQGPKEELPDAPKVCLWEVWNLCQTKCLEIGLKQEIQRMCQQSTRKKDLRDWISVGSNSHVLRFGPEKPGCGSGIPTSELCAAWICRVFCWLTHTHTHAYTCHSSFSNLFKYLPLPDATAKTAFMICGPSGWLLVIWLVVWNMFVSFCFHLLERGIMILLELALNYLGRCQPPTSDGLCTVMKSPRRIVWEGSLRHCNNHLESRSQCGSGKKKCREGWLRLIGWDLPASWNLP